MSSRRLSAAGALIVLVLAASIATAGGPQWQGLSLQSALERLQRDGLKLLFSSVVVRPGMMVMKEPTSTKPRALLDEILSPLGLRTQEGPGGSILILAARAAPTDSSSEDGTELPTRPTSGRDFVQRVLVRPVRPALAPPDQGLGRVIDRSELSLIPTAGGDASGIVESLPGITAGGASAAFMARGAQPRDVSMVLDGLEIYEPFHLQSLNSPFSLVDGANLDRVEFLGAGLTAELGDRHGGFVELLTTSPSDAGGTRIEVGSLNSRLAYSAPTSFGSVLVSGRAWYPEAMGNSIEAGQEGLSPRFGDAYFKVTFHADERTILSAHGLTSFDRLRFSDPKASDSLHLDNRGAYAWIRAQRAWTDTLFTETVLSAGRIDRTREGVADPDDGPVSIEDRRRLGFVGLRHDLSWEFAESRLLRGGVQVRPLRAAYDYTLSENGLTERRRLDPSSTALSIYLSYRAALSERFSTETGLRWDRQTHTMDSQMSPRVNAVWRASDRTEIRFGLGHYYQSQRIHELSIEDGQSEFLPAELARQAAVSVQHRFDRGPSFRVDAYVRKIHNTQPRFENLFDPIEIFPEAEPDRVLIASDGARLRGVELLLEGSRNRPFHWWVSYVWSRADDLIDGEAVLRSWDETHAGKMLLAWRHKDRWSVAMTGAVHTGWPTTPVTGQFVSTDDGPIIEPVMGARNTDRLPLYLRFDVKASRRFAFPQGDVRVDLDILNVTNRRNACCVDDFLFNPLPNGDIDVSRRLDTWLGVRPMLSLTYAF